MPAVLVECGIVDTDAGLAGHEFLPQLPMRHRRAIKIGDTARDDLLGIGKTVVMQYEGFELGSDVGRALARHGHDFRHVLADLLFRMRRHEKPRQEWDESSTGKAMLRRVAPGSNGASGRPAATRGGSPLRRHDAQYGSAGTPPVGRR